MLAILLAAGCATTLPSAPQKTSLINIPALNIEADAEIGQSMVSTARKVETPAIKLDSALTHNGGTWKLSISNGVLPMYLSNEKGSFYRVQGPLVLTTLGVSQPDAIGGVFIPNDKTKPTEVFWMGVYGSPVRDVHPGIEVQNARYEIWGKDSFKRELIYSGVSQNTISILYREFQNDMARPAFSQELKYDLTQGSAIGYKGARFEVIKANNTGIVYKVLKALD